MTKNEKEKEYVLHVVSKYHKEPNQTKPNQTKPNWRKNKQIRNT